MIARLIKLYYKIFYRHIYSMNRKHSRDYAKPPPPILIVSPMTLTISPHRDAITLAPATEPDCAPLSRRRTASAAPAPWVILKFLLRMRSAREMMGNTTNTRKSPKSLDFEALRREDSMDERTSVKVDGTRIELVPTPREEEDKGRGKGVAAPDRRATA